MKNKMFGFLKNLWRQPASLPVPPQETGQIPVSKSTPAPAYAAHAAAQPRRNMVTSNGHQEHGTGIVVSLRGILEALPLEVQNRVLQQQVGDLTISVPLEKVLSQLSRGSVKVPFGELRVAAPAIFSQEPDRDKVLVPLPLSEIVSRLNPALIACRRVQRKVEVPEDIRSPFDANGQGLVLSTSPTTPESATPARHITPAAPTPAPAAPATPTGLAPGRQNISFTPPPTAPTITPISPITPIAPRLAATPRPSAAPAAKSPMRPIAMPSAPSVPPASPLAKTTEAAPSPTTAPKLNGGTLKMSGTPPAAPAPAALAPAAPAPAEPEPLLVGLTALAEAWPEAVRKEIVESNLVDTRLALPYHAVEQALRLGRIAFSWKTLRAWFRPTPLAGASAHDGTVLELPLKVVAPLFLARQREASKGQHKVAIDEEIPNLFFGAAPADPNRAAVATPALPADTNYYVWSETSDSVPERELDSHSPSAGTKFITKYATPNEIVSRAASLEGVVGALIALPDGLMVANRLPADLNGDTLAAFLPQIFAKVSQCTRELRMGELNNLNFTVGNVPWKIFRVNAIFFAAFGKAGQPLPTGQLAALAAELDHKPK